MPLHLARVARNVSDKVATLLRERFGRASNGSLMKQTSLFALDTKIRLGLLEPGTTDHSFASRQQRASAPRYSSLTCPPSAFNLRAGPKTAGSATPAARQWPRHVSITCKLKLRLILSIASPGQNIPMCRCACSRALALWLTGASASEHVGGLGTVLLPASIHVWTVVVRSAFS